MSDDDAALGCCVVFLLVLVVGVIVFVVEKVSAFLKLFWGLVKGACTTIWDFKVPILIALAGIVAICVLVHHFGEKEENSGTEDSDGDDENSGDNDGDSGGTEGGTSQKATVNKNSGTSAAKNFSTSTANGAAGWPRPSHASDLAFYKECFAEFREVYERLSAFRTFEKFLFGLRVPVPGAEVDVRLVMLHESGVYVFWRRNFFEGTVVASERGDFWRRRFESGCGNFENPVRQNEVQIQALREFLQKECGEKFGELPCYHSFFVVGGECKLESSIGEAGLHRAVKFEDLEKAFKTAAVKTGKVFTKQEVFKLYWKLSRFCVTGEFEGETGAPNREEKAETAPKADPSAKPNQNQYEEPKKENSEGKRQREAEKSRKVDLDDRLNELQKARHSAEKRGKSTPKTFTDAEIETENLDDAFWKVDWPEPEDEIIFVGKKRYEASEWREQTGFHYEKVFADKTPEGLGRLGEYRVYDALREVPAARKFLCDALIEWEADRGVSSTEIDLIMLHKTGIYVFESKNLHGEVWVGETGELALNGEKMGNPLAQNSAHLKVLKNFLKWKFEEKFGEKFRSMKLFHSFIVFGDKAELSVAAPEEPFGQESGNSEPKIKFLENGSLETGIWRLKYGGILHTILKREDLLRKFRNVAYREQERLSLGEIREIYEALYPATQASEARRKAHRERMRQRHGRKPGTAQNSRETRPKRF